MAGIQAPIGDDLEVKSDASLDVEAAEGVQVQGRDITMEAAGEISFVAGMSKSKSVSKSVCLQVYV